MDYLDYVNMTFNAHEDLLNYMGLRIKRRKGQLLFEEPMKIVNDRMTLGRLIIEEQNLEDFYRYKTPILNMTLDKLNFNKDYKRHYKLLFHTLLEYKDVHFNCYNALLTKEFRRTIYLSNQDVDISYSIDEGLDLKVKQDLSMNKIIFYDSLLEKGKVKTLKIK